MIRFDNVTFGYALRRPILRRCSFTVTAGERVAITGASGKGKTTLLRLILGLEKPRKGTVTVPDGTRFSVVFQEDRLIESATVRHNVALFSDDDTARDVLARMGLADVTEAMPHELSGGMRRRVALARALAHPFDVLVLDEPTTGLDRDTAQRCLAEIDRAAQGKTVILVSHDAADAAALGATERPLTALCETM